MQDTITCPSCGNPVEITEALREHIKREVFSSLTKKHKEEIAKVREQIKDELTHKISKKYRQKSELLQKELEDKEKRLEQFRKEEIALLQKTRRLEEKEKELQLELERKLSQERKKIEQQVILRTQEQYHLREKEYEKRIQDLKKALDEAQRKAQQGSQQLQGEVFELDIEEVLRQNFPYDDISEIGKGKRGADVKQIVKSRMGKICGVILWEVKRTKAWKDVWIEKLKEDVRREKANISVIVSTALPSEAQSGIGLKQGVWVCDAIFVIPLAMLIRKRIHDVAKERFIQKNRGSKTDLVYDYVTGHEFAQQVEALVEAFSQMQTQIEKERMVFEKTWKQREAQIRKLVMSTANIYGSLQGIVGSSMPQVKGLEFNQLKSGTEKK